MTSITRPDALPTRRQWGRVVATIGLKAAAAGVVTTALVMVEPVRSVAAATSDCNPQAVVPESPAGPLLLVVAALAALGLVAYRRRQRGVSATILSVLAVVVLCGALLGTVFAAAATSSCPGGVSATSSSDATAESTPLTGADVPWIAGGVLILSGAVFVAISPGRRRGSRKG